MQKMEETTELNEAYKIFEALAEIVKGINQKILCYEYQDIIKGYNQKWIVAEGPAKRLNSHCFVNIRIFNSVEELYEFYKDKIVSNMYAYKIDNDSNKIQSLADVLLRYCKLDDDDIESGETTIFYEPGSSLEEFVA